jgi:hypothetical protein
LLLGGLGAAVAMLLGTASSALAVSNLTVDDPGDSPDIANDGVCDATGAENCTLRAAIQEADDGNGAETDTIGFAVGLQDATIALGSALPTIDEPTAINGCAVIDANHAGPCVGVRPNLLTDNAFAVSGSGVTVSGLAISHAAIGIDGLDGSSGLTVRNDWFGISLPASPYTADANTVGMIMRDGGGTVGGTGGATGATPADRNVFANGTQGLQILGGDNNQVLGNYFGTRPDGTTAAAQNEGIEVVSELAGPDTASGNQIGAAVSVGAAGTTACDGACNLISGASGGDGYGVDLAGNGGGERPSSGSVVAGNFVGLDVSGTAALGNQNGGVALNTAINAVLGGPDPASRNFITGPAYALFAEPPTSGSSALIQNNYLGLNSAGSAIVSPSNFALAALRGSSGNPVLFKDNRLAENSTDAIRVGSHATFTGNIFGIGSGGQNLIGGSSAIDVSNSAPGITIGGTGPGDANTIGNAIGDAISLNASTGAIIQGNLIGTDSNGADRGNGGAGIELLNGPGTEIPTGNLIGGDSAAAENVISNNAGDAIRDSTAPALPGTGNVIARNRGSNNGSTANDLFIDLGANGPGNTTSNGGIPAPAIGSATTVAVSGTAQAGAVVRIFKTATTAGSVPGEITGFLGQATADGSGNWSLPNAAALGLASGERVSANQTGAAGSSELSGAVTAVLADVTAPETAIGSHPKKKTFKRRGTFTFSSTEPGSTFLCSFDGKPYAACSASFTTPKLTKGRHRFDVLSTDAVGNRDQSPASFLWKVIKRKRR